MFKRLLVREIVLVLVVKLAILYGLWWICFSHPVDKNLSATTMASHLFSNPQANTHD